MKKYNSHILAVTTNAVKAAFDFATEEKFIEFEPGIEGFPFHGNDIWVGPREHLESMESFKQIIPYVVVTRDEKILVYKRTNKGGEARLHEQLSIGFGGHIDIGDITDKNNGESIDLETTIGGAVTRELSEELESDLSGFEAYGMLLDESNEVGRVHLGVIMLAKVSGMVTSKEDKIELMGFKSIEDIIANIDNYESWSQVVANYMSASEKGTA